ncbi:hypothetical protein SGUI_1336 [Serinicoccus hydrothermalis]|uniref:Uncharacterized protein n=1 Tax=Serinicoccus hydrothermalis TaxID=1758689 RepID=A0A1B1NBD3_9MICO|nr:hypothetical protein SGUI_1336 [Serinicoccus hydrothermalis]
MAEGSAAHRPRAMCRLTHVAILPDRPAPRHPGSGARRSAQRGARSVGGPT